MTDSDKSVRNPVTRQSASPVSCCADHSQLSQCSVNCMHRMLLRLLYAFIIGILWVFGTKQAFGINKQKLIFVIPMLATVYRSQLVHYSHNFPQALLTACWQQTEALDPVRIRVQHVQVRIQTKTLHVPKLCVCLWDQRPDLDKPAQHVKEEPWRTYVVGVSSGRGYGFSGAAWTQITWKTYYNNFT